MLELWGGHECTVNRTRDGCRDQTVLSGHEVRIDDLERFAQLGCRALRYPVLWERVSPSRPDQRDWGWSDERLARLRELSIRPIVGLVHHGSGPAYTDLLDAGFAAGLAAHAEAVAVRYPWIDDWTPVNEPLTTARFSALYGHWYPHVADEVSFWTALLNQIDGVRLSMKAVRRINPDARLIQTEDLGRTYATPPLREQARFDNLRRWMTWDLLTGRVTADHGLFERLSRFGLADRLRAIADDPCPPDVIGVNHYLTGTAFWTTAWTDIRPRPTAATRPRPSPMSRRCGCCCRDRTGWRAFCAKPTHATVCPWPSPRFTTAARAKNRCDGFWRRGGRPSGCGGRACRFAR
jgi:dTDP-4-dehydrorhamnose reductase